MVTNVQQTKSISISLTYQKEQNGDQHVSVNPRSKRSVEDNENAVSDSKMHERVIKGSYPNKELPDSDRARDASNIPLYFPPDIEKDIEDDLKNEIRDHILINYDENDQSPDIALEMIAAVLLSAHLKADSREGNQERMSQARKYLSALESEDKNDPLYKDALRASLKSYPLKDILRKPINRIKGIIKNNRDRGIVSPPSLRYKLARAESLLDRFYIITGPVKNKS